jgi:peroxiredoxin
MMRRGKTGVTVISSRKLLLCSVVITLFSFSAVAWSSEAGVNVGDSVPEFTLKGLDGRSVSFENRIRGKAPLTLLFFMTTACSACYEELKEISNFVRKNPNKLDVWCVAVDLRGEKTVMPYQKTNRFHVNYLIDPKFSLPRVFGFNYTPSLAIVDAKGVVLHKKGGYSPNESIPDLIRTFLP